ncbi:hypothetical protein T440DRAFT_92867 [Plenodomus tracheiphilus IPT5]|uniref:Uncharacterized protein n=1 Tax=Plenodomus tracheiphilus IPT5 TaxID=1408161 RepID=A0A6A7BK70_9PLEO|nr:hypothetical protein T440DRAFT_92867 [Plenodomus tracheiphilus IPT5]
MSLQTKQIRIWSTPCGARALGPCTGAMVKVMTMLTSGVFLNPGDANSPRAWLYMQPNRRASNLLPLAINFSFLSFSFLPLNLYQLSRNLQHFSYM